VVPISIKEFANKEKLSELASAFSDNFDGKTVLIASTHFSQNLDNQADLFHKELSENLFETMDKTGIDQMDVDSRNVIFTLFEYLELIEAQTAEFNDSFFTFYEGDPNSSDRALTIMAFGDMMLGRYVRTLMDKNGHSYIFENIAGYEKRFFEGADVVFGNLEGPINGQGTSGGTSMVFSFNEDIAPFLKKYGFNLLSITNNHATDQGWAGRDSTIKALENSSMGWCGHPSQADIESVYYNEVGDKTYAFLCFHDVTYKLDDEAAINLIKEVRPTVDYLVVSIHWGYEYGHTPDWTHQVEPGRAFIDAGADFIIGHHPHVVQSFEVYNGKLIFYSLGNFVFDQYWSTATQEELALGIYLNDQDGKFVTKVYLFPMKSELSQSRLMTEEERKIWIEEFINYADYDEDMEKMIRNGIIEIEK
jgi:poly-gamma-glutamate synthesis protein (capsule biosynthesis protein)